MLATCAYIESRRLSLSPSPSLHLSTIPPSLHHIIRAFVSYAIDLTMLIDGQPTSDDEKKGGVPKNAELGSHFLERDSAMFQVRIIPLYLSR